MKLVRNDATLDVLVDGISIDNLGTDQKDIIRKQLADMLRKSRPHLLRHIALMMMCEYGTYEGRDRVLDLKSKYTIADLDEIPVSIDLFLRAGIKRGYAHRFVCIADRLHCDTLGDLFCKPPRIVSQIRWCGKATLKILHDFFMDQYEMEWK